MFYTAILDTIIGLIFTFMTVSLIVSAATESIASAFKWRANTLLQGIKDLLNDQTFDGLAKKLYDHALVNPRFGGVPAETTPPLDNAAPMASAAGAVPTGAAVQPGKKPAIIPAYIDPNDFAAAFMDIVGLCGTPTDKFQSEIDKIKSPQIQQLLRGIVQRTDADTTQMRNALATWFDASMDRVSGVYKRRVQWVSFVLALLIAIIMNVNSVQVAKTLWRQPEMVKNLSLSTMPTTVSANDQLQKLPLPIGWTSSDWIRLKASAHDPIGTLTQGKWLVILFGWLITAGATLFGAPFWFDTLQQFVRLKGNGPSPAEKASNTGAAA